MDKINYKDNIINALNKTVEIFTSHSEKEFNDVISKGMQPTANAGGLDRICIFKLLKKTGRLGQIYVWAYGNTVPLDEELVELPNNNSILRWLKILIKGESITIRTDKAPLDDTEFLGKFGIKSVIMVPIFTHNAFWGIVSLEDHSNYHDFEDDTMNILRSMALLSANAFIRNELAQSIAEADELTKAVTEASPIAYILFDENLNVIDCNDVTLKIFACSDKQYFFDNYWEVFLPEFQPDGISSREKIKQNRDEISGGRRISFKWVYQSLNGEQIPMENLLTQVSHRDRKLLISYNYDLRNTEIMMDNIKKQSELLKTRLEQQKIISDISQGFISSGISQTYIKEALSKLGNYHKVSQTLIFNLDIKQKKSILKYQWSIADAPLALAENDEIIKMVISAFPEKLPDYATLPVISCSDTSSSKIEAFHIMSSVNISAFVVTPLYVEGILWGYLSVEQCYKPRQWNNDDIAFIKMTASTIAGVIMRDIYNTKLKDALRSATIASRAKGDFLSNMSHEIRTPLNAIIGMTTIGVNSTGLERKDYAFKKIEDASAHLLGVINDILDMSKIEANKFDLSPVEFDFEKMLQRITGVISFRTEKNKQKLTINIDNKIPKLIIQDEQRLAQVITNLLGNAVKFTGEEGSIQLNAELLNEIQGIFTIQVSVIDTGIGISKEQQSRLFQSFQQAESNMVRKYGGTGLGLVISKNIVEMMGGKIWVESQINKGSTFSFTIQAKNGGSADNLSDIPITENETPENLTGIFSGKKILLAEDVEINREIIETLLEPTSVEVDSAENGNQALQMFKENPERYDLILMDIQMPELNGYDASCLIRKYEEESGKKDKKSVPIIALSANVFKEDIEKSYEAGMNGHIGKPVQFNDLLEILRSYLLKEKVNGENGNN